MVASSRSGAAIWTSFAPSCCECSRSRDESAAESSRDCTSCSRAAVAASTSARSPRESLALRLGARRLDLDLEPLHLGRGASARGGELHERLLRRSSPRRLLPQLRPQRLLRALGLSRAARASISAPRRRPRRRGGAPAPRAACSASTPCTRRSTSAEAPPPPPPSPPPPSAPDCARPRSSLSSRAIASSPPAPRGHLAVPRRDVSSESCADLRAELASAAPTCARSRCFSASRSCRSLAQQPLPHLLSERAASSTASFSCRAALSCASKVDDLGEDALVPFDVLRHLRHRARVVPRLLPHRRLVGARLVRCAASTRIVACAARCRRGRRRPRQRWRPSCAAAAAAKRRRGRRRLLRRRARRRRRPRRRRRLHDDGMRRRRRRRRRRAGCGPGPGAERGRGGGSGGRLPARGRENGDAPRGAPAAALRMPSHSCCGRCVVTRGGRVRPRGSAIPMRRVDRRPPRRAARRDLRPYEFMRDCARVAPAPPWPAQTSRGLRSVGRGLWCSISSPFSWPKPHPPHVSLDVLAPDPLATNGRRRERPDYTKLL